MSQNSFTAVVIDSDPESIAIIRVVNVNVLRNSDF